MQNVSSLAKRLSEHVWDGDLAAYVRKGRRAGKPWRLLAREVWDLSGGLIDVTDQTLRKWYPDPESRRGAA